MDSRQNLNCSQVWINPQRMVLILAKESMICERVMDFCVCFILAKQVSAKMNVPAMYKILIKEFYFEKMTHFEWEPCVVD